MAVVLAFSLGCAHRAPAPREPANVATSADVLAVASQPYQDAVVEEAFLLGPADAHGHRPPVCWINPSNRPDLVPKYLRTGARGRNVDFGLPACADAQLSEIQQIASRATGSEVAFLPVVAGAAVAAGAVLGTVCAIDFALTAAMMVAVNSRANRVRKSADRQNESGNAIGIGGTLIGGGNLLWALASGSAVTGAPALVAAVITTCTFGGGAVGYLLVPLKK